MKRTIGWPLIASSFWGLLCALPAIAGGFDLQGHRGARGLAPENSLPAATPTPKVGQ